MHTRIWKKAAVALTFWMALHASSLPAQIFTAPLQASTTGSNPVDFEFRADGTLIALGNFGVGSLLSTDQGAGTRMLWFPDLGAFRAGTITSGGTEWDQANIGAYSIAMGMNTLASGSNATALGLSTTASGYGSTALGWSTTASNVGSTALGYGATSSGPFSIALGTYSTASGTQALAFGFADSSLGSFSTAMGFLSTASGPESVAIGFQASASGSQATAMGTATSAASFGSFAIGQYNIGGGNGSSWVATDPLFEVGNGTSASSPADAMVVYKNGDADFQGVVTVAPGGDIPMFTGN